MTYYPLPISVAIDPFYKNLKNTNFGAIDQNRLKEIFEISKILKIEIDKKFIKLSKLQRHERIIYFIRSNPKQYNIKGEAEAFILFMFAVDPTFEAIKIYSESNNIKEIKSKMIETFGIFDKNLIRLERFTVEKLLSEEKRKEVNEILEQRAFK